MERNVLFNDTLNTFYLQLYGVGTCPWKEMFYLTTHSTHFISAIWRRNVPMERNVLFNDTLNTFYLQLYGVGTCQWKEMFYLTTHSTHFIYSYMASERAHGKKCFI